MNQPTRRLAFVLAAALAMGVVFAIDCVTPLGHATGVLYVVPVCIIACTRRPGLVWLSGSVATLLLLLGVEVSPSSETDIAPFATNRLFSMLAIWTTTIIAALHARLFREERRKRRQLDEALARLESAHQDLRSQSEQQMLRARAMASVIQDLGIEKSRLGEQVEIRQRVENALRDKTAEMEQLLYVVSHDLKSPLVTISGFTGLLESQIAAREMDAVRDSVVRVRRGAETMGRLIDELLELSRVATREFALEWVELDAVVREAVHALELPLATAEATVVVAPDLPRVRGDHSQLLRVVLNLVENAIRYGCPEPDASIRISAERTDSEIVLCVDDSGPGVEPEYAERIFKLFQRLSKDHDGTGIGLATVAKIVERHGGRAWVESTPGHGASFRCSFPTKNRVPLPDHADAIVTE